MLPDQMDDAGRTTHGARSRWAMSVLDDASTDSRACGDCRIHQMYAPSSASTYAVATRGHLRRSRRSPIVLTSMPRHAGPKTRCVACTPQDLGGSAVLLHPCGTI